MVPRGPVVIRRRLGARLRELREGAGLRLEDAASALECSASKISRLESGQGIPKVRDVRDLIDLYEVADRQVRERLVRMAQDGRAQGWWTYYSDAVSANLDLYISLEAESSAIRIYSVLVLHGLIQTEDYARAVLTRALPTHDPEEIGRLARLRIARQDVISRSEGPVNLVVVIDEAAIHKLVGSAEVMADQLEHLISIASWENVELLLLPFHSGVGAAISTFCIFQPSDDRDHTVVNLESTAHDAYFEEETDVLKYNNILEDLRARSLSHDDFDDLLRARIELLRTRR